MAEEGLLNSVEVRVLGALVEKEFTTPDYYPLTLNALTNACNQSSNRDPMVSFDEQTVVRGLDVLREKKLAYLFDGAQSRVPRYGHRFTQAFELTRPEASALCVLMLRGPQTVGEIRGRTGRMHEFVTWDEAEAVLAALATRSPRPLVAKLPRQSGFKEQRHIHLLSGASIETSVSTPAVEPATLAVRAENERLGELENAVAALKGEIGELRKEMAEFRKQFE